MKLNFRSKILIPTTILIVLILVVTLVVTISQFSRFTEQLVDERLYVAANGLRGITEELRTSAIDRGTHVATDPQLAQAVLNKDTQEILRVIDQLMPRYGISTMSIADDEPLILARSFERERYGDPLITPALAAALDGIVSVAYTPLRGYHMPIRAAVPIHYERQVIGIAFVGFALDTQESVDALSERFGGAAVTVLVDDLLVASTMLDENGNSVVGTTLDDADILRRLENREEVFTTSTFYGRDYSAFYMPLIGSDGNMFGSMFIGLPLHDINSQNAETVFTVVIISLIGLVVAIVLMHLLVNRLTKPISALTFAAEQMSEGNMNVNVPNIKSNDEIGKLAQSFRHMSAAVVDTIEQVQKKSLYIASGNFDTSKGDFSAKGDFQKVLDGIDIVAESFIQYLDEMPCGITLFDKDHHITFLNAHNRAAGLDPARLLGKTAKEAFPADYANTLSEKFKQTAASGKPIHYAMEKQLPDGNVTHMDYTTISIKDSDGKVVAFLNFAYDTTELVGAQKRSAKINDFQNHEAQGLTKYLQEGLGKGILKFDFVPEAYDADTAEAATAYKLIGDTMRQAIAFIKDYVDEVNNTLAAIASGNLAIRINREYVGDFDSIKHSVNSIVSRLNETVVDISLVADGVSSGTAQLSQSSANLSESTTRQLQSMQEVTGGISSVEIGAQGNSENAQKAADLASTSKGNAEASSSEMKNLLDAMERINVSSNEISKIISTIEGIAFQTNLLALNAAVEAARAGEHGKGFSVVAEEVRSLAQRSAKAAQQTSGLIEESIENVQDGKKAASDTAASLEKIVQNVLDVSEVINEIYTASTKQTEAIGGINKDLRNINQAVHSSAATSEETAAAAEELDSQVHILNSKLAFFSTSLGALSVNKVWDATTSDSVSASSLRTAHGDHKQFAQGETIIQEGDTDTDAMYFVLEGSVKVIKSHGTLNEKVLATLKTGDLFGEMALFLKEPRSASVVAVSNVTVIEVRQGALSQFMGSSPDTAYAIIETLCRRLKNLLADSSAY